MLTSIPSTGYAGGYPYRGYLLIKSKQFNSNQMLVFDERGKPEYPGKNLTRDQAIGDWWKASALTLRQSYSTEL